MEIFGPKTNVPGINGHVAEPKTSEENAERPATRAMQVGHTTRVNHEVNLHKSKNDNVTVTT